MHLRSNKVRHFEPLEDIHIERLVPRTLASQAASSSTRKRNPPALACLPRRSAQHAARRFRRKFSALANNVAQGWIVMLSSVEKCAGKGKVELSLPPVTRIVVWRKKE